MNTQQLLHCLHQDKVIRKYALGVYPADGLPQVTIWPSCFIANLDPANKPGSHWIAVFIDSEGVGECFDSYGRSPCESLNKYLKKYCKTILYNPVRIQGPLSSSCGQYCVYYLCHRARDRTMSKIVADFCSDFPLNDLSVADYINRHFNLNLPAYDLHFILSQICKPEK